MRVLTTLLLLVFSSVAVGEDEESILAELNDDDRKVAELILSDEKPPVLFELKTGDIGKFHQSGHNVIQVVDDTTMIIKANVGRNLTKKGGRLNYESKNVICWIEGVSTTDIVDGGGVTIQCFLRVAGTKRYETTTGSNTVKHLVCAETKELLSAVEKIKELRLFRIWKSKGGVYQIDAKYIGYEKGVVTLEKRDGEQVKLDKGDLSSADQKWVREKVKAEK